MLNIRISMKCVIIKDAELCKACGLGHCFLCDLLLDGKGGICLIEFDRNYNISVFSL